MHGPHYLFEACMLANNLLRQDVSRLYMPEWRAYRYRRSQEHRLPYKRELRPRVSVLHAHTCDDNMPGELLQCRYTTR